MKIDIRPIHIVLKDGTVLDCVIYKNGNKGELPIQDFDKVCEILESDSSIHFQTRTINGHTHTSNIESYTVYEDGLRHLYSY